jgi:hypothetical protein
MLAHIENINISVLASTQDHVNASKRLNDFAVALARIEKNADSPNEGLKTHMASVTTILRAASDELAQGDEVPNWRGAPASVH